MKKEERAQRTMEELEELLKIDTDNYTNISSSICVKIYKLENVTIPEYKRTVTNLENQIENVHYDFEKKKKEIEDLVPEKNTPVAKIKLNSKKKKLLAEAEKEKLEKIEILTNRLKRAKDAYAENRVRCQELINKLEHKENISWHEMRRVVSEKIAQGFLQLEKNSKLLKSKNEGSLNIKRMPVGKTKQGETTSDGGRTFKEKNIISKHDYYKLKGLTLSEKAEYEELLSHLLYDEGACSNSEIAWKLRFALVQDQQKRFRNLALRTSDKALVDGLFSYYIKDRGRVYQRDFEKIIQSRTQSSLKRQFFAEKAFYMLYDSGHDKDFIRKHGREYARELEMLFSNPIEMKYVLDRLQNQRGDEYTANKEFQKELRIEIDRRVQQKHQNLEYNHKPRTGAKGEIPPPPKVMGR